MKVKSLSVLLFACVFATACSDKQDAESKAEKSEEGKTSIVVSEDIMTPLAGTDPCFEAVEFVRDEGDIATYRAYGDKILLKDDYIEQHGHKTYIGTIGRLIKENKSIPEIRQTLLNKCRAFMKAREKPKTSE